MEITHLVMCDEHVMLSAFSQLGDIDLSTRGNSDWRMGTARSYGKEFPVIINYGGQLEKMMWPIGEETQSVAPAAPAPSLDWFPEQRALIPVISYRARVASASGIPQYKSVRATKQNEIFFVAAYYHSTGDYQRPVSVRPAFIEASGDRVAWANSEPLVLSADSARAWLFPQEGFSPTVENESLVSSDFRRELVSS
jgi:hypothetical protein